MTEYTDDRLRALVPLVRQEAGRVGSLSALWDGVLSAEALLAGGSHWPYQSRAEAVRKLTDWFESSLAENEAKESA